MRDGAVVCDVVKTERRLCAGDLPLNLRYPKWGQASAKDSTPPLGILWQEANTSMVNDRAEASGARIDLPGAGHAGGMLSA